MRLVAVLTDTPGSRRHAGTVRSVEALALVASTSAVVVAAGLVSVPAASADTSVLLASRWPSVPDGHALSLEDQITERLTQIGNSLGEHLDLLSHDMFRLRVDARQRRAHLRIGGGDSEGLAVRLDGDIQFDDLSAHVCARLDLALRGHAVRLELPPFEMSPVSYRGDHGVELRVPLLVQRF
jgi:hypothetical protein